MRVLEGLVEMVINVPGQTNHRAISSGYRIRRAAIDSGGEYVFIFVFCLLLFMFTLLLLLCSADCCGSNETQGLSNGSCTVESMKKIIKGLGFRAYGLSI